MSKRKSQQKQKRKQKLQIPRTVEEARKSLKSPIPAGWDNAALIKIRAEQFDRAEIEELARAIFEYMASKDLTKPGQSWQDFILISVLKEVYRNSAIRERMSRLGENAEIADLRLIFENLPAEIVASDEEVVTIMKRLRERKPKYEDVTYDEVVLEISKLREFTVDVNTLKKRNLLTEIEKVVESVVKKHEQNKWIVLIEGILLGLISNGLYELLKYALESLVRRAPYTEAQIYEVESDVFSEIEKWQNAIAEADGFEEQDTVIALFYVLHVVCVLSVLGPAVPSNPLFDETNLVDSFVKRWINRIKIYQN